MFMAFGVDPFPIFDLSLVKTALVPSSELSSVRQPETARMESSNSASNAADEGGGDLFKVSKRIWRLRLRNRVELQQLPNHVVVSLAFL